MHILNGVDAMTKSMGLLQDRFSTFITDLDHRMNAVTPAVAAPAQPVTEASDREMLPSISEEIDRKMAIESAAFHRHTSKLTAALKNLTELHQSERTRLASLQQRVEYLEGELRQAVASNQSAVATNNQYATEMSAMALRVTELEAERDLAAAHRAARDTKIDDVLARQASDTADVAQHLKELEEAYHTEVSSITQVVESQGNAIHASRESIVRMDQTLDNNRESLDTRIHDLEEAAEFVADEVKELVLHRDQTAKRPPTTQQIPTEIEQPLPPRCVTKNKRIDEYFPPQARTKVDQLTRREAAERDKLDRSKWALTQRVASRHQRIKTIYSLKRRLSKIDLGQDHSAYHSAFFPYSSAEEHISREPDEHAQLAYLKRVERSADAGYRRQSDEIRELKLSKDYELTPSDIEELEADELRDYWTDSSIDCNSELDADSVQSADSVSEIYGRGPVLFPPSTDVG